MPRKLIEVALPLDAINRESAREKSIRHGHPSTLHLWWARRPLATCRAVLFSSMVDDPDEADAPQEYLDALDTLDSKGDRREKLFRFIEKLVTWENSNDKHIIGTAQRLIRLCAGGELPPVLDPFAGGGSIPLEAQRLGLEARASDLNPVAVLINKAMIEIPPKFAGRPPVNPDVQGNGTKNTGSWNGANGLAEDVRYYGQWMRDEAEKRIGHLYPKGPNGETVIAWLWARTVTCPNPACGAQMPLIRSFELSKKKGKRAWAVPIIDHDAKTVSFEVHTGEGTPPEGTVERTGAKCIVCGQPVGFDHIRAEGRAERMGAQLMAVVLDGDKGREYIAPTDEHVAAAQTANPHDVPDTTLPEQALGFRVQLYGMVKHKHLFTPRQLVALTTFSDLIGEARERIIADASASGMADDGVGISDGGTGATAYADAVTTYLAFAVSRITPYWCALATWHSGGEKMQGVFSRQAIPMVWDYAENNPFCTSTGNFVGSLKWIMKVIEAWLGNAPGFAKQLDATVAVNGVKSPVFSTDPPYYDNIGYADLSDFFYVWLRRSLQQVYPELLSTMLVPKATELVATPYRFDGSKQKAAEFFEDGLRTTFVNMRKRQSSRFPMTVYYAFKQAETNKHGTASTGWETMLEGLLAADFTIEGTWPMRTEMEARALSRMGTNALASSVVLACRPRPEDAPMASRAEFLSGLRSELPVALRKLQKSNIAPVDLAQAAIGPGMSIFSRYSKVLESNGQSMSVRTALELINEALDDILAEQEGAFDSDTRWAVAWFEQNSFAEGLYGDAETLSKAKNTSVSGMVSAGILKSGVGKVRLLSLDELPKDWDPTRDKRVTMWEVAHYLIRALQEEGEHGAGVLLSRVGENGEIARDLAYRLYSICERRNWSKEALGYNSLVSSWPQIQAAARGLRVPGQSNDLSMSFD